jgi:hypothetical protein
MIPREGEGKGMEPLRELQQALEEKLEATRKMIDEYDEMIDYATQCTLQGFAEGLAFALEETKSLIG